jgi:hypothetical protein
MRLTCTQLSRALLLAAPLALLSACTDDPVGVDDGADYSTPATISKAWGDGQSAPTGQPFPEPLRVIVFTSTGHKCNGCEVIWTLSPGQFDGGPIRARTVVTGASQLFVTSLTPRGTYTVRATLQNGSSVDFRLTAL